MTNVQLRAVTEGDLPILFEYQQDPEASQMAAFPAREHDAFMAHWRKILADKSVVAMSVIVDGRVAGNIGSWPQDGERKVGYWLGREHWGKGVATQMLSMFLEVVTERPLHAHVVKHNRASIRVLEKCGFKLNASATAALEPMEDGIKELIFELHA